MRFKSTLPILLLVSCADAPPGLFAELPVLTSIPSLMGEPSTRINWQQTDGVFQVFDHRTRSVQEFSSEAKMFKFDQHVLIPGGSKDGVWRLVGDTNNSHFLATDKSLHLFGGGGARLAETWTPGFDIEKVGFADDMQMMVAIGDSAKKIAVSVVGDYLEFSQQGIFELEEEFADDLQRLRSPILLSSGVLVGLGQHDTILTADLNDAFGNGSLNLISETPIADVAFSELIKVSDVPGARLAIGYDSKQAVLLDLESFAVLDAVTTWSGSYSLSYHGSPHLVINATKDCERNCMIELVWADVDNRELQKNTISIDGRGVRQSWLVPETKRFMTVRGFHRQFSVAEDSLRISRVEAYDLDTGLLQLSSDHPSKASFYFGIEQYLVVSPSLLGELRVFRSEDGVEQQKLAAYNQKWLQGIFRERKIEPR